MLRLYLFLPRQVRDLIKYELVDHIVDAQTMRITTGVLNEILTEAVAMKQPPSDKG